MEKKERKVFGWDDKRWLSGKGWTIWRSQLDMSDFSEEQRKLFWAFIKKADKKGEPYTILQELKRFDGLVKSPKIHKINYFKKGEGHNIYSFSYENLLLFPVEDIHTQHYSIRKNVVLERILEEGVERLLFPKLLCADISQYMNDKLGENKILIKEIYIDDLEITMEGGEVKAKVNEFFVHTKFFGEEDDWRFLSWEYEKEGDVHLFNPYRGRMKTLAEGVAPKDILQSFGINDRDTFVSAREIKAWLEEAINQFLPSGEEVYRINGKVEEVYKKYVEESLARLQEKDKAKEEILVKERKKREEFEKARKAGRERLKEIGGWNFLYDASFEELLPYTEDKVLHTVARVSLLEEFGVKYILITSSTDQLHVFRNKEEESIYWSGYHRKTDIDDPLLNWEPY